MNSAADDSATKSDVEILPGSINELDARIGRLFQKIADEPIYLPYHQVIFRYAMKRKALGGRPIGLTIPTFHKRSAIDRFIEIERKWTNDPINLKLIVNLLNAISDVERQSGQDMSEIAELFGQLAIEFNRSTR